MTELSHLKVVKPGEAEADPGLIALLEEVLARVRGGETLAVALVEVKTAGRVATVWNGASRGWFHHLTSGAAILAARMANDQ